jgi:hypothetical protein
LVFQFTAESARAGVHQQTCTGERVQARLVAGDRLALSVGCIHGPSGKSTHPQLRRTGTLFPRNSTLPPSILPEPTGLWGEEVVRVVHALDGGQPLGDIEGGRREIADVASEEHLLLHGQALRQLV